MRRYSHSNKVLLILCLMYLILYVDRVNISTAAPLIKADLDLSNTELGLVFSAFAYPYLLFQIIGGWVGDHFGPRKTLFWCGMIWAAATIMTGFVTGIVSLFAARVALGGDASTSLHRALAQVEPRLTPTSPAVVVAAVFALYRHDAAATAASLDHLAAALEAERSARRDAAAAVGEVRMSAITVPVIAAATGALLLSSDQAALAAALSFPLLPMLAAAVVIVVLAALAARRLATP